MVLWSSFGQTEDNFTLRRVRLKKNPQLRIWGNKTVKRLHM